MFSTKSADIATLCWCAFLLVLSALAGGVAVWMAGQGLGFDWGLPQSCGAGSLIMMAMVGWRYRAGDRGEDLCCRVLAASWAVPLLLWGTYELHQLW